MYCNVCTSILAVGNVSPAKSVSVGVAGEPWLTVDFQYSAMKKPWDNLLLRVWRVMILPKEVVLLLNIGMPISWL
jgi:hypothetical protein